MELFLSRHPQCETLRRVHEQMMMWSDVYRDADRGIVIKASPLWYLMMSVRDPDRDESGRWRDFEIGARPKMPQPENLNAIATKIEAVLCDKDIWRGRWREREILVTFYKHPRWSITKIARKVSQPGDLVRGHELKERLCKTLLYLSAFV